MPNKGSPMSALITFTNEIGQIGNMLLVPDKSHNYVEQALENINERQKRANKEVKVIYTVSFAFFLFFHFSRLTNANMFL